MFCVGVAGAAMAATCGLPFATTTPLATATATSAFAFRGPSPKSPKDFSLSLAQIQGFLNYKDRFLGGDDRNHLGAKRALMLPVILFAGAYSLLELAGALVVVDNELAESIQLRSQFFVRYAKQNKIRRISLL